MHVDPYMQSPCYLDMKWALAETKIKEDEARKKYGDKALSSFPSEDINVENAIILSDYYKIKEIPKKLLKLSNGEQVIEGFKDDLVISEALQYEINGQRVWIVTVPAG